MGYMVTRWIHEAPEDEQQAQAAPADQGEDPGEAGGEDQAAENPDEGGGDEDFDIDTSLDGEDDEGGGDEGGDDMGGGEAPPPSDTGAEGEAEPVKANTDIFASLTAEEQQIKIAEQKKMYKNLYSSVNDLIHRVDNMMLDEDIMQVMTNLSTILHNLLDEIADYFENKYSYSSYFDNDVKFNEFLLVLNKITNVVNDVTNRRNKRLGKDSPNSQENHDNI